MSSQLTTKPVDYHYAQMEPGLHAFARIVKREYHLAVDGNLEQSYKASDSYAARFMDARVAVVLCRLWDLEKVIR